jgi:hypothetical protein
MDKKLEEKAKKAKSAEELWRMAKEQGIPLSDSQAEALYQQTHSPERALSDEELNNVTGGSCSTATELPKKYQQVPRTSICSDFVWGYGVISRTPENRNCGNCHFCSVSCDQVPEEQQSSNPSDNDTYFCEKRPA